MDPQGKAIQHALSAIGFNEVKDVRLGKYIELELSKAEKFEVEKKLKEMCEKLLSNTVIEEYRFEIEACSPQPTAGSKLK